MTKVVDVLGALEKAAPLGYAADFDNAGFLVGHGEKEVRRVAVALDITRRVIDEAAEKGANLIVSHHPVIFNARKSITDSDATGAILLHLIENGISAICMHTNMDSAQGGVNDLLAEAVGVEDLCPIEPIGDSGAGGGRYGVLKEKKEFSAFLEHVCNAVSANGLRYYNAGKAVHRVAVGGGSCGSYIGAVACLGCDTFVTADIKHDVFLEAQELGINLIDAGHFATEDIVCPHMRDIIKAAFPCLDVEIAESDTDCVKFFTR